MNADGQRYHLLLGRPDWARCRAADGTPLALEWDAAAPLPTEVPGWDEASSELTIAPRLDVLPPTRADVELSPDLRRAAAADAYGNVYWIGSDPGQLFVQSRGDGSIATFWPDPRAARPAQVLFTPSAPAPDPAPAYTALAATSDAWLVAATATGLDSFDLVAGGPPLHFDWPKGEAPAVTDMAARCGGGLWLLDGDKAALYELDRTLTMTPGSEAPEPDLFQPLSGEAREHAPARRAEPHSLKVLDPAIKPCAIAALPGGWLAVLSRDPDLLCLFKPGASEQPDPLPLDFVPHDLLFAEVLLRGSKGAERVLVAGGTGNQVRGFRFEPEGPHGPRLVSTTESFPLRRYGGRALVSIAGQAAYDSGPEPRWTRIVEQPRRRYQTGAQLLTPRFDSQLPGAKWDRLRCDGCVPPGTRLQVEAWASDDDGPPPRWLAQPDPILVMSGSELAHHSASAVLPTDPVSRHGTFELLFQRIEGRYLHLRLTLLGDGSASPHLRALRASWPRVSWSERYLPAVYRQDPEPADFLERFLANMQGTVGAIEDRSATAQALFDPRTVPVEALGWLAEWFDLALDPQLSEAARRAFVAHAVRFFGWRGTIRGLESALALAFGLPLDATLFGSGDCSCAGAIRIVETYRTRRLGRIAAGDSSLVADAPVLDAGLEEQGRWQAFQRLRGRSGSAVMLQLPRLSVPTAYAADWAAFVATRGHNREAWQRFLSGRHRRIAALNRAHGSAWASFSEIALCDQDPATAAARRDWADFTDSLLAIDRSAHRFSVLLPVAPGEPYDSAALEGRRKLAQRIVDLEKPAHTIFDVRFYFAMNRIGEARLGIDTAIGAGSRSEETLPRAILGRAYLGEAFMGPFAEPLSPDRTRLAC